MFDGKDFIIFWYEIKYMAQRQKQTGESSPYLNKHRVGNGLNYLYFEKKILKKYLPFEINFYKMKRIFHIYSITCAIRQFWSFEDVDSFCTGPLIKFSSYPAMAY